MSKRLSYILESQILNTAKPR